MSRYWLAARRIDLWPGRWVRGRYKGSPVGGIVVDVEKYGRAWKAWVRIEGDDCPDPMGRLVSMSDLRVHR